MTLEQLTALDYDLSVPTFTLNIGGTTFDETDGLVTDVSVDATMDGADRFDLTMASRFDHETSEFVDFDWDDVPVGEHVEIALGYQTPEELSTMFVGSITELGTDFPSGGAPTISVSGYGRYHELTTRVVTEQWKDQTDAEIVEEIAGEYGLEPDVKQTEDDASREVDYNNEESDADYLEKLAERNDDGEDHYRVYARRNELVFRPPAKDSEPVLELAYGESLDSFSPSFIDARTLDGIEVRHWDPEKKEEIVGTAGDVDGQRTRTVKRPVSSQTEAEDIARRLLHEREDEQFQGSGETIGLPDLDVDQTVDLTGLGKRFSGTYYITDVTHTIDTNGYRTSFDVRLAREGDDA